MITEFTCGIFKAVADPINTRFMLLIGGSSIGYITGDGESIKLYSSHPYFTQDSLIEIAVLMNNIKRQYKQLQTN